MPRNPAYNSGRADAQSNGLTHDNKAANPNKHYSQGMNQFNLSYDFDITERYADVSPFLAMDVNGRDEIPFRAFHKLSSYTMKSPNLDKIHKHKFYTLVPYRAIIPIAWERFYTNPTHGDDVPDDVYPSVDLLTLYRLYLEKTKDMVDNDRISFPEYIRFYIATESIFSTGSLLSSLKMPFWPMMFYRNDTTDPMTFYSYDNFFDELCNDKIFHHVQLEVEIQPNVYEYFNVTNTDIITLLDILRSGNYNRIQFYQYENTLDDLMQLLLDKFRAFLDLLSQVEFNEYEGFNVDLSWPLAYQISCVSQVTDSSIDYLFNANLFRQYLFPIDDTNIDFYNINGYTTQYDNLSGRMLLWHFETDFSATCAKIFSFAKSLKFGDYFTQARPQPLAVGDTSISDDPDVPEGIRVARSLVYTRFLNWNNRVGPKYEDYYKELTGMSPLPENDEPSIINHSTGVVSGFEVENTGDAQLTDKNSVTTLLRDTNSQFEFDIVVSEPSILLGLTSYDIPVKYTRGIDRAHFKSDRFDFFNHMLQYTGDQEIYGKELDLRFGMTPVAYTTKDMHYKIAVSRASGGFIQNLPSWSFTQQLSDRDYSMRRGINPLFIRNQNHDFDRFYSSLTGYSLGNYFHFILNYQNDLSNVKRAMDVAPDIL